jgi:hypothetical protein
MGPVWFVRSRQLAESLRHWLIVVGYDRRDHSLTHKIYLVYAFIFFALWIFAMLAFLSSTALQFLAPFHLSSIPAAATGFSTIMLLVWGLYTAYQAGKHSPMSFSENDAYLICQSPVSRRAVAFAWLTGSWPLQAALMGAVGVVLAYASTEAALAGQTTLADAPLYLMAGLRCLLVMVPVVGGVQALVWAFGCLRLRGSSRLPRLWMVPTALGLILVVGLFASGSPLQNLTSGPWSVILSPLIFPLASGYGLENWLSGLLAGAAWVVVGASTLWLTANGINLGQAAQETTRQVARQNAAASGFNDVADQITLQQKLGVGHLPASFTAQPGWGIILWKNLLRTERRGAWSFFSAWLIIFLTGLAAVLIPDWGGRGWALLVWGRLVSQQTNLYQRADLAMWGLFRSLPIPPRLTLLADVAVPAALATLLAWLAILGGGLAGTTGGLTAWAALLVPGLVLGFGLGSAVDILRTAKSQVLMAGNAANTGWVNLAITASLLALAVVSAGWLAGKGLPLWLACLVAFFLGLLAIWGLLELARNMLKRVE